LEEFETRLGHKLILSALDFNHEWVARAFHIIGVYRTQLQATEKQYVFVLLSAARKMLKLRNAVSEVSVILPEYRIAGEIKEDLNIALSGRPYEVQTWKELLPILMAYLQIFNGFIYVWYLVIFVAMGFGVVNTMLMAVFERMREFGLSMALGVKPLRVIRQVLTESFLLLLMGSAAGNILGLSSAFILSRKGIDFTSFAEGAEYIGVSRVVYPVLSAQDVMIANLVVFCLGLLVSLYPAAKAARFTPVKALGHT
jgi:ABC-type lipoprotein release transport system permease subunit